eukprot:symbB.v1.2.006551.t1/scaffold391.1/size216359/6
MSLPVASHEEDPVVLSKLLSGVEVRLDQLSNQVEACLLEILSLKDLRDSVPRPSAGRRLAPRSSILPQLFHTSQTHSDADTRRAWSSPLDDPRASQLSTFSEVASLRNEMVSFNDNHPRRASPDSIDIRKEEKARRLFRPVRGVDLKIAWQIHARELRLHECDEETRPIMRLLYRHRCADLWELVDDPDSSRAAWWLSIFLKLVVFINMAVAFFQSIEGHIFTATLGVVGTFCDVIFCLEFLTRIIAAPSKLVHIMDPFNWTDFLSALALPLRITLVLQPELRPIEVMLLFFLPAVCSLKLLRYFESFRLLIDACRNSVPALPVLVYTMSVITLLSSSAIYLVESRDNIPSMPHALWLALVTVTTVGYGDFAPKSAAGYVVVSILSCVSVLFLGLPVGIIGHEFKACWESRSRVLLMTRVRKCLAKWGYTAQDLRVLVEFVDEDGDGNLNLSEFIALINQMRIGIRAEVAVQLFMLFDDDQNGFLDLCMLSIAQLMVTAVYTVTMAHVALNMENLSLCLG